MPDYDYDRKVQKGIISPEEARANLKRRGILPPTPYSEKPVFISCSGGAFEPFVPPEGDGKAALMSKEVIIVYQLLN